jgi:hypothetical protein
LEGRDVGDRLGDSASSSGALTATGVVGSVAIDLLAGDHHPPPQLDRRLSPSRCESPPQGRALSKHDKAARRRCLVVAHRQSVSVAASSIIMASRFLASSSCRFAISAILRSR